MMNHGNHDGPGRAVRRLGEQAAQEVRQGDPSL